MSKDRRRTAPRILVVDDEDSIRDALATALRYEGFAVDEARDGREALLEAERFQPDVVILDRKLPEIEGTEVGRRLRERGWRMPILFLTATEAGDEQGDALDAGEDVFVTKPFSLDDVIARIRAMLRRTVH